MKHLFTLIIFLAVVTTSKAQIPSSCVIPAPLYQVYEQDIKNMAVRRMMDLQHPDTAFIEIPQAWIDTIGGGLAAIFNTAIPERDTIFNKYCVHDLANNYVVYQSILVAVDTSYAWTQPWQNINTVTGNPDIDSLILNYGFSIDNFYFWSFGTVAVLSTGEFINIYALFDSLEMVPGVLYAEPNGLFGVAGRIDYEQTGQDRYYDFYFQFNDCFDGCDNYRKWSFKVNPDCSVEYLGFSDWGVFGIQPLPPPINCNLFPVGVYETEAGIKINIYPNPVTDYMYVEIDAAHNVILTILNLAGQTVANFETENNTMLDLKHLKQGAYLLHVTDRDGRIAETLFIKK